MLDHRSEDDDLEDDRMEEIYTEHLRTVKFMLGYRRHFEVLHVQHGEALLEPALMAKSLNDFLSGSLGGDLDVEAMAAVVDPTLYRNRA